MNNFDNPVFDSEFDYNASVEKFSEKFFDKKAIIIGAGPAGLTAAYELLKRTNILPIIVEKSTDIGGISKTVNYKGNRMDIGGHRFFSKSDRVMNWWLNIMPVATSEDHLTISYQQQSQKITPGTSGNASSNNEKVMLVRQRLSRIYFLRKFFTYPVQLSLDTLTKLGVGRTTAILFSYLKAQLFPRKPEKNLEDFMINRFGVTLYKLFFKDYTEKVWGIPCHDISAEWGAQRIKGVSISKAIQHAIQTTIKKKKNDIGQKETETSLIEQFLYPPLGPGQLWEEVARQVQEMGGIILMQHNVKHIYTAENNTINAITAVNHASGETVLLKGDYFFSTMPVQELIESMGRHIPAEVKEVANGLQYRDFITVGILLKQLSFYHKKTAEWKPLQLKDTWIYIQEKAVKVGRLQLFNNWSPFMVKDPDTIWIGMEFFCNKQDDFWNVQDKDLEKLAIAELEKIGLAARANVLDATVLRMEKTYPAYFGTYDQFHKIQMYTDNFENLFLIGRNGMHKYNNADHSMLTAMVAVDNICAKVKTKTNIWAINTEQTYHEKKTMQASLTNDKNPVGKSTNLHQTASYPNLWSFIFNNTAYKWLVWFSITSIIVQFIIFKFLYPYAGFIDGDSYHYLNAAANNSSIAIYPIGYSKFLRLFSVFSTSDTALVAFQYFFIQFSVLTFLFTICYFYKPARLTKILLFGFMLFNPVFLYLANYITSDAIFLSLSFIWFTQLIWIIHRPTNRLIFINALVLFITFTVRYNALFYPVIFLIAILLAKHKTWMKIVGLVVNLSLIGIFVQFNSNKYVALTGHRQFMPFSGWQLANNAMYAYQQIDSQQVKPVPPPLQPLDKMVRDFYNEHPQRMKVGTYYMWSDNSPLRKYLNNYAKLKKDTSYYKVWATIAPLIGDYGSFIIRNYPMEFVKYYLLPNALNYYIPPVEYLEYYNMGMNSIGPEAKTWFNFKTNQVKTYFKNPKVSVLNFYPVFTSIMNVVLLFSAISFVLLQGYKQHPFLKKGLIIAVILWLLNFGFSVFASPIALRFQLFPILVSLSFAILLVEYLVKSTKETTGEKYNLPVENLTTQKPTIS